MNTRRLLRYSTLESKYPEHFEDLCKLIISRGKTGHFETREVYSVGDENMTMVRHFSNHFTEAGFTCYCGTIPFSNIEFPFISVHWD